MARNINGRLSQLQIRRRGTDRLDKLNKTAQAEITIGSKLLESWQKRAITQPYTRYALGAMQEVGPEITLALAFILPSELVNSFKTD
jgi:hypothetical protein